MTHKTHPTPLSRTLAPLLFSLCLGFSQVSLAKEKKTAAAQCEHNSAMNACPDSSASGTTVQSPSFKAQQAEEAVDTPVKKKKGKKSEGKKKAKRSKSAEESGA